MQATPAPLGMSKFLLTLLWPVSIKTKGHYMQNRVKLRGHQSVWVKHLGTHEGLKLCGGGTEEENSDNMQHIQATEQGVQTSH